MVENINLHPAAASAARSASRIMAVQLAAAMIDLNDRDACARLLLLGWWAPFVACCLDDAIAAARGFSREISELADERRVEARRDEIVLVLQLGPYGVED